MDDERIVRDVYDAAYPRLVGQLTAVTGSRAEAEDVVQEAFVRALTHRMSRVDNPEAWVRTVAVNLARSRWRRAQRLIGLLPALAPAAAEDVPDHATLMAALRELPPAQREAIALHHFADLPVSEVAQTLGVPLGTVKARLSRARTALAVHLEDVHD